MVKKPTGTRPLMGGKKPEKAKYQPEFVSNSGTGGAIGGGSSFGQNNSNSYGGSIGLLGSKKTSPDRSGAPQRWGLNDPVIEAKDSAVGEEELEDENSVKDGSYIGRNTSSSNNNHNISEPVMSETVKDNSITDASRITSVQKRGSLGFGNDSGSKTPVISKNDAPSSKYYMPS